MKKLLARIIREVSPQVDDEEEAPSGAIMVGIIILVIMLIPFAWINSLGKMVTIFVAIWAIIVAGLVTLTNLGVWSLPIGLILAYLAGAVTTTLWLIYPSSLSRQITK